MAVETVTFKGKPVTLEGKRPRLNEKAPDFTAIDRDLKEVHLSDFGDKIKIISVAVSLDTPVCNAQLRKFNEEAAKLGEAVVVINITMDLPFAISRFCEAEGIEHVVTLSDYRYASFGQNYGLLIKELRLLARAVLVLDRDNTIKLSQIVPEITEHPDYKCAIAEAERLLARVG
jgi:thiol peroxidase